ncbi:DUF4222 domain-containing protein [Proteus mirabilis]|uniref:DUF4222 domain-containing protein n=1 Tax=Proteus mirabilis TaxID=584 RepID=UPI00351DBB7A
MSNENPNQLDRYYKNHRGIVVHVVRYDREKQRVIFMLDGCDDPSVNLYSVLKRSTHVLSNEVAR